MEFETIPPSLKLGIICPVYKGHGRDPLSPDSYRGITLTSVLTKTLERLFHARLSSTLLERGIPHRNQTGFVKNTSCSDAIFATYESLSKFAREGDTTYLCLFDLAKAFDMVQYPVLLQRSYECGVVGRAWRLLRSWYTSPQCRVKVNGQLSDSFSLQRGVLQGSVLSPSLFLMIMDPLLRTLEQEKLGPVFSGLFGGGFAHADDIRTVSLSKDTLQKQVSLVEDFAMRNCLNLNETKCEVVVISSLKPSPESVCSLGSHPLPTKHSAKCLGFWWSWDLSADRSVDEAIAKARKSYFAYGAIGAFHGLLNPLSGRSIYESCVEPVLLYGCENWFPTNSLLDKLEAFQAEIGRRILKLSSHHSTLAVRLGLEWPSVSSRILLKKLHFLSHLQSQEDCISKQFLNVLTKDPLKKTPLQLLDGCLFLENKLGLSGLTQKVKTSSISNTVVKKVILESDRKQRILLASSHESTSLASDVANTLNFLKLWDTALDYGPKGTSAIQRLYKEITRPIYGLKPCPRCDASDITHPYFHHFIKEHTSMEDANSVLSLLSALELSELVKFKF